MAFSMRYLIVSDLHANLEGLEAVLSAVENRYDRVICCGDLVGYGPDPNAAVEWVRAHAAAVVRGNHDKACCGVSDAEDFNQVARTAAQWTRQQLTAENLAYLRALPVGPMVVDGFQIVHGSIQDEDEYLFDVADAKPEFVQLGYPVTFFGHTHMQGGFFRQAAGAIRAIQPAFSAGVASMSLELEERGQYLLNAGSVGQPRDGDSRAAVIIYSREGELGQVEYWRVPYDIAATQQKMQDAGLPYVLALRLSLGR